MKPRPLMLIYRALGLGDLLTALPALHGLAVAFPDHHRLLVAPGELAPLARLTGVLHGVLAARPFEVPAVRRVAIAVNLHGRGPQSHRTLLALRPRHLIAFANRGVPETAGFPPWDPEQHEVVRWCGLLAAFGIACDPARLDLLPPRAPPPRAAAGATLIHPGAASPARRWPEARWVELARREMARGHSVAITAGPGEEPAALRIAQVAGLGKEAVLSGLDLDELAAAVQAADRVIAADTGVAHLATALRRPSVVIFGPSSPAAWGPPARPEHQVLWHGRRGDAHGRAVDPGLLQVTVDEVETAIQ